LLITNRYNPKMPSLYRYRVLLKVKKYLMLP
jgi:hypothetical protein